MDSVTFDRWMLFEPYQLAWKPQGMLLMLGTNQHLLF